jgi:hypothetical protein
LWITGFAASAFIPYDYARKVQPVNLRPNAAIETLSPPQFLEAQNTPDEANTEILPSSH